MVDVVAANYAKFVDVIERNKLFCNIERFVVLFSCGKDCAMLLDLLLRYCAERHISTPLEVFSVPYPKHMYYNDDWLINDNFFEIKDYWQNRSVRIIYTVPEEADFGDNNIYGCKTCKRVRKSVIDPFVNSRDEGTGILTGFTMYDALAYLNMLLLTCNYDLNSISELPEPTKTTTSKMLHKMSLRECLPNKKYMIRPILPFSECEINDYLRAQKIPFLTKPCKISKYKFKRQYSKALDVFDYFPTYNGIEKFLLRNGIRINNNGLSFDDVIDENFFIDC